MAGMTEPLITTGQLARNLGVSRQAVGAWARQGLITPARRTPGGEYRWIASEVDRQLAARTELQEAPMPESTQPERPPVVAAIVTRGSSVLAGRRNDGKPPWTFISGEVEPGESIADAAVREVKEETGLEVHVGDHEIGRRVHPKTGRTMIYLPAKISGSKDRPIVGDPEELAEVRWLSLGDLEERMAPAGGVYGPVLEYLRETLARRRR